MIMLKRPRYDALLLHIKYEVVPTITYVTRHTDEETQQQLL